MVPSVKAVLKAVPSNGVLSVCPCLSAHLLAPLAVEDIAGVLRTADSGSRGAQDRGTFGAFAAVASLEVCQETPTSPCSSSSTPGKVALLWGRCWDRQVGMSWESLARGRTERAAADGCAGGAAGKEAVEGTPGAGTARVAWRRRGCAAPLLSSVPAAPSPAALLFPVGLRAAAAPSQEDAQKLWQSPVPWEWELPAAGGESRLYLSSVDADSTSPVVLQLRAQGRQLLLCLIKVLSPCSLPLCSRCLLLPGSGPPGRASLGLCFSMCLRGKLEQHLRLAS